MSNDFVLWENETEFNRWHESEKIRRGIPYQSKEGGIITTDVALFEKHPIENKGFSFVDRDMSDTRTLDKKSDEELKQEGFDRENKFILSDEKPQSGQDLF